jgi:hypothetical protein
VLLDRQNLPMHRRWLAFVCAATLGAIAWYLLHSSGTTRWPGGSSLPGLTFGILAALIIVFEFLLWPRRWHKLRAVRIGRTQTWLRAHIWLGLLSVPLVVLHSGFQWGGPLSTWLAGVFAVVIASGVFGLIMQQAIPRLMLQATPAETIYSQIDYVSQQFAADAQRMVLAACGGEREPSQNDQGEILTPDLSQKEREDEAFVVIGAVRTVGSVRGKVLATQSRAGRVANPQALRSAFFDSIKPYLEQGGAAGSLLADRNRAAIWFDGLRAGAGPDGQQTIAALETWCEHRRQFDLQGRLHRWLHGWLSIHLPLSAALLILLAAHIYAAIKYW